MSAIKFLWEMLCIEVRIWRVERYNARMREENALLEAERAWLRAQCDRMEAENREMAGEQGKDNDR